MTETAKLLGVWKVDRQLAGLTGRLKTAERFLEQQQAQLDDLSRQREQAEGQRKHLAAEAAELESESAGIESRIEKLREQMNNAKTNKEYQTFLVEINTLKLQKSEAETQALERMNKIDELKTKLADLDSRIGERQRVRQVAADDRDKRAGEIEGRVSELRSEREKLAAEAPAPAFRIYEELLAQRDEDAMAPVEIQDRKRHEFTCGGCMMSLTVETVSGLLGHGRLTRCTSCGCILYMSDEARDAMQPAKR